ncbi:MAG: transglycosylase domain-containing protein [Selenomonadaceae bacterium]|nr:transglycosylase domain-containing protein [Selenomonadaceae bacterium]
MGKIKRLRSIKQAVNEEMLDKEHYVVLEEIPLSLRRAIIAVEDSHFYSHSGFDLSGIARAAIVNFEAGHIEEGGSTITQQLVKNLFLSQEQSFTRKAEELLLALDMERNFTKDEILELYFNTIYFGSNFYGIYDAAKGYFGVEPKDLTIAESAMLAGLPNAPSVYSPYVDYMLAKKRQLVVIDAMVKANILTKSEAEKVKVDTIILAKE